jgi:hypothetical protein
MKKIKEKGLGILISQFLLLDHSLKLFLVGPPNCTYTLLHLKFNFYKINFIKSCS